MKNFLITTFPFSTGFDGNNEYAKKKNQVKNAMGKTKSLKEILFRFPVIRFGFASSSICIYFGCAQFETKKEMKKKTNKERVSQLD